jgi:hypothetical protein
MLGIKHTYEYIKRQIEKEGYKLLSDIYINSKIKLKVQCDKGHVYKVKFNNFQQGGRCSECNKNKLKHTYEYIKRQIEYVDGYKLLSKKYINNHTKLSIICNEGHIYSVKYNNFSSGARCPHCAGKAKHTYEYIKQQIENEEGYKLISNEYKDARSKIKIQCDKGHVYKVKFNSFQQGGRCPKCYSENSFSKGEKEVLKVVKKLTDEQVLENDRTQIINPKTGYNLELDIYIPSINKAIEYNGEYWHSSEHVKYKDKEKVIQCKKKGIDFLVIKEKDWCNNQQSCKKIIRQFIIN